jgi:3-hydroxy-9,10-secoandrosta-1,3,5(10)-triene-9,17-dione monooxygenase reductase component
MPDTLPHQANFRAVFGRLPTGVVIIAGGHDEHPSGLVVGSFVSVSLEPPLAAFFPAKSSTSWPAIGRAGAFCANVLGAEQEELARAFARSGGNKFAGIEWRPAAATQSPVLPGVAAWIDCRIQSVAEAGDHWCVLAEVLELSVDSDGGALVFHGGSLKALA